MTEGTPAPEGSRHEIETRIVKRCWENEEFRREFLKDPAACFVKYLNVPAAQVPKIVVHEEQAGTWHIVIPARPEKADELSDEDLEKIAGGTDVFVTVTFLVVTAATGASLSAGTAKSGW